MKNNSKIIAKNTIYAFVIKGFALCISFFSTPAFIAYFNNNDVLGLWYTLLAMLSWFLTFDLGIGNGIRNHLVKAIAENNRIRIRQVLSSGFTTVCVVSVIIFAFGCILIHFSDLNSILNISQTLISERVLKICTYLIFTAIMMRFMLTTISSVFYALQRSAVNNFLSLCVSVLQFAFIVIFHFDNIETALLNISIAYLIICNFPVILAGIYVFCRELKDCRPSLHYITKNSVQDILGIGSIFFFCQIFYLIIANTNEFFVSHYWIPNDTADYSFYYRITLLVSMMVSLALTPTWSMITKAYAEKDYVWLRKLYQGFKLVGLVIVCMQFMLVPFLQPIMDLWLGKGVLDVNLHTAIAFACFGAVFLYSSMLSTIVCGLAKMRLQLYCYGIGAISKVVFIIFIAKVSSDWTWVVWSNVFILVPYCLLQQLSLNRLFEKLKDK